MSPRIALSLAIALAVAASTGGCGGDDDDAPTTGTATTVPATAATTSGGGADAAADPTASAPTTKGCVVRELRSGPQGSLQQVRAGGTADLIVPARDVELRLQPLSARLAPAVSHGGRTVTAKRGRFLLVRYRVTNRGTESALPVAYVADRMLAGAQDGTWFASPRACPVVALATAAAGLPDWNADLRAGGTRTAIAAYVVPSSATGLRWALPSASAVFTLETG